MHKIIVCNSVDIQIKYKQNYRHIDKNIAVGIYICNFVIGLCFKFNTPFFLHCWHFTFHRRISEVKLFRCGLNQLLGQFREDCNYRLKISYRVLQGAEYIFLSEPVVSGLLPVEVIMLQSWMRGSFECSEFLLFASQRSHSHKMLCISYHETQPDFLKHMNKCWTPPGQIFFPFF